jgi:hypothetical protein
MLVLTAVSSMNPSLAGQGTLAHESSVDAPEPRRLAAVLPLAGFF